MTVPWGFRGENRQTLNCRGCGRSYRIAPVGPELGVGMWKYCPTCGSEQISAIQDQDQDYWEALGASFGLPAEIISVIYAEWDPHEHRRFRDFVEELRSEVAAGADKK